MRRGEAVLIARVGVANGSDVIEKA